MDNWGTEEKKKESDVTRKILVAIMILLLIIIFVIIALLLNIQKNTFKVIKDGEEVTNTSDLIKTVGNTTYISIQDFAKIVGAEYSKGEYKVFSSDEDKCYIKSTTETASFYLNSNKVCKLKVNDLSENYDVFTFNDNIIQISGKFYAPIDAVKVGFNVKIQLTQNRMLITTLDKLLKNIDSSLNENAKDENATYSSLLEEEFDNQKAVLYDYIILSKKDSGLYSLIKTNGEQILPDKYKNIKFLESTKEFIVTNSLDKMGIVDQNGKNKVEQLYDSIKVINSNPKLYLVELNEKFGVIDENGNTIVYPEYDNIGVDTTVYKDLQNQYILLNNIIPACKDNKYGLFDVKGNKVLDVNYDGIGCGLNSVDVGGTTKAVSPVVEIEDCNGIVIKNGEDYDLFLLNDKKLVSLKVSSIYYISNSGQKEYYMIYQDKELNLIERLIKANIIKEKNNDNGSENNTIENNTNTIQNNAINNILTNNVANTNNQNLQQ